MSTPGLPPRLGRLVRNSRQPIPWLFQNDLPSFRFLDRVAIPLPPVRTERPSHLPQVRRADSPYSLQIKGVRNKKKLPSWVQKRGNPEVDIGFPFASLSNNLKKVHPTPPSSHTKTLYIYREREREDKHSQSLSRPAPDRCRCRWWRHRAPANRCRCRRWRPPQSLSLHLGKGWLSFEGAIYPEQSRGTPCNLPDM